HKGQLFGKRMRIRCKVWGPPFPVRFIRNEAELSTFTVRRQPKVEERLIRAVVPGSDFHDLPRVAPGRDLASEQLCSLRHELYLADGSHPPSFLGPPDRVFNADADVLAERNCRHAEWIDGSHPRFHEHDAAMGRPSNVLHHVERVAAGGAA